MQYHRGVRELLEHNSILITGATGFVGKVLLEKIIRSATNVKHIFLLIRPKSEISATKRMTEEILQSPIFNRIKTDIGADAFNQLVKDKVSAIAGDISFEQCGISERDRAILAQQVSIVFHCAASIDFEERIDRAIELNVRGALKMYDLALSFESCKAFVHVSTCYVNSNLPHQAHAEEKLYDPGFEPEDILVQVGQMTEEQLEYFPKSGMLRNWPNTYTFTKAIAEHLLVRKFEATKRRIPLAISRPAIVTAAWKEPCPGWVDDISAASAVYAGISLGALHFSPASFYGIIDFIPVDLVVNAVLLSAAAVVAQPVCFI
jgi:thioester reductase-like protein